MLDAIHFEARGIPAAALITAPFAPTCRAMSKLQGYPDYPLVIAPHPVTSLDRDGVDALADRLTPAVEAQLLRL